MQSIHSVVLDNIFKTCNFVSGFAEKGIKVSNTPDVLSNGVADMGMAMLMASARNIYHGKEHFIICGPLDITSFSLTHWLILSEYKFTPKIWK